MIHFIVAGSLLHQGAKHNWFSGLFHHLGYILSFLLHYVFLLAILFFITFNAGVIVAVFYKLSLFLLSEDGGRCKFLERFFGIPHQDTLASYTP